MVMGWSCCDFLAVFALIRDGRFVVGGRVEWCFLVCFSGRHRGKAWCRSGGNDVLVKAAVVFVELFRMTS